MSLQPLARKREQTVRLGADHGYRIEGDQAFINADLSLPALFSAQGFALELWACPSAHQAGPLAGTKVCDVPLELPTPLSTYLHHVDARTDVRLPLHGQPHAMVLALVEKTPDGQRNVHDFSNYWRPETFDVPHFEGSVGYSLHGSEVSLHADGVTNPRGAGNLSGTLSIELWASPEAVGDAEPELCLASVALPCLSGQHFLPAPGGRVPFAEPPAGRWNLTLLLREWTLAHGYVTRDRRSFAQPYERPAAEANEPVIAEVEPALVQAEVAPARVVAEVAPVQVPADIDPRPSRRGAVCIQTASAEELAKVKGLNLKLAKEIIKARPFESLDQLVKVRGIGAKMLQRLKPLLTISMRTKGG